MAERRKKAGPDKGVVETRAFVEYVPAGVRINPYEGNEPLLDPDLEKVRDEESKALSEIKVTPREEPSIDPELVKERDKAIERDAKRAKDAGIETRATVTTDSAAAKPAPKKSTGSNSK